MEKFELYQQLMLVQKSIALSIQGILPSPSGSTFAYFNE